MKKIVPVLLFAAFLACTQGPPAPELISPPDGSMLTTLPFRWFSVAEASEYLIEIAPDRDFLGNLVVEKSTPDTTFDVHDYSSQFEGGNYYYWRVRSGNDNGWGHPSEVRSFQVVGGGK